MPITGEFTRPQTVFKVGNCNMVDYENEKRPIGRFNTGRVKS